jgi:3',5'-cyclic AMP phosphodiesterase CpdA
MPFVSLPTRRGFLRSTVLSGAALAFGAEQTSTRWALLSDTHVPADPENVYRGFKPRENTKRAIADAARSTPDGMAICGDLARLTGQVEDYQALSTLLDPVSGQTPVAMALGNHDDRANFLKIFSRAPGRSADVKNKHVLVVDSGPVRFILLDSLMLVNITPGHLGVAQRSWLDKHLQSADSRPTMLFVHHTLNDSDGSLLDADRFLNLIRPHRSVKAVFYGHSHRYSYEELDGIHLVNLPAVGYNFADAEPVGWVTGAFRKDGADLTLHAFGGNTEGDGKSKSLRWRS